MIESAERKVELLEAQLAELREHTLDSNPALRALHDMAVLYRNAVEAYCQIHGPLSTTLEWVIRYGSLSGNVAVPIPEDSL
jgi:hypothetical protein